MENPPSLSDFKPFLSSPLTPLMRKDKDNSTKLLDLTRNESKLSRISHLSIRSLRGDTIDEDADQVDGEDEPKKPIYLFDCLTALCPWMPRMSLPGLMLSI